MARHVPFNRATRVGKNVSEMIRRIPDNATTIALTGDLPVGVLGGTGEMEFAVEVLVGGEWKTYCKAEWKAPTSVQPNVSINARPIRGMDARCWINAPRAILAGLFLDID